MGSGTSKPENKPVDSTKSTTTSKQVPVVSVPNISQAAGALRGDLITNKVTSIIPGFT